MTKFLTILLVLSTPIFINGADYKKYLHATIKMSYSNLFTYIIPVLSFMKYPLVIITN